MRVLLSIKPKYAELILSGEKKYEFRRAIFRNPDVNKVVIYASSPISKVIGEFIIDDILTCNLTDLWLHTMEHAGIDKEYYDSYFSGKDRGHAIKVKSVKRYSRHKELNEFNVKRAPQSFAYL